MAYGLLYGMGKHALAKNMGVLPEQAQQLSDSFRASISILVRISLYFTKCSAVPLAHMHALGCGVLAACTSNVTHAVLGKR
jgi:hypothetical protein